MTAPDARTSTADRGSEGRELDAEVCQVVFGREVFRCTDTIHAAGVGCLIWRYRFRSDEEPDHVSAEPGVPPYSSDMSAAWRVVERMQRPVIFQAFYVALAEHLNRASSVTLVPEYALFKRSAPKAAEAICRAALKTIRALAVPAERGGIGETP